MQNALFFIAVLPDIEIRKEVTGFKQFAAQNFDSRHALKSPPHITLKAPFWWKVSDIPVLQRALVSFCLEQNPFFLTLSGFNCFAPRVIFVDVEKEPALVRLEADLRDFLFQQFEIKDRKSHQFTPHMTVAFKDLKKKIFPEAWKYFSKLEYQRMFQVSGLTLLKHNGQFWEEIREFGFL